MSNPIKTWIDVRHGGVARVAARGRSISRGHGNGVAMRSSQMLGMQSAVNSNFVLMTVSSFA
ncbi:hypothetical protein T08_14621 [Trichinella sp. T8]|nr:hypothetical protein T08_14621 [Trichinella sp. T8]